MGRAMRRSIFTKSVPSELEVDLGIA